MRGRAGVAFPATAVLATVVLAGATPAAAQSVERPHLRVGSKKFTESVILAEIAAQLWRGSGFEVEHQSELGGTRLVWNALTAGELDAYPEYTGTLREEILRAEAAGGEDLATDAGLERALAAHGVEIAARLAFQNTYALGMRSERAAELDLRRISDLRSHPDLVYGFGNEFLDRADGWPGLRAHYGLPQKKGAGVSGLDHDLAYRGLAAGELDVIDLYSTDAEIRYYDLAVLEDDRGYFPSYRAVLLVRADLEERAPEAVRTLRRLEGRIDAAEMTALNARAKLDGVSEPRVAADYLQASLGITTEVREESAWWLLVRNGRDHLALVALSLAAAVLAAVPLGILAARRPRLGTWVLGAVGILQTIPSLALFAFMIPLLGIGAAPAVAALFLYSLLPVVRNTHAGLGDIPRELLESADALGLPPRARLARIELPLAARSILAGIKTSAVINVGTATLGALVGAGGYGQPILTGIRLDDLNLILLQGAVPAAALALLVQGLFDGLERVVLPRGLRHAGR